MAFELPPLPFAKNALEPVMKSETFDYHYDKHHKAYVTKLNQLLEGKPEASKSLVEVIKSSTGGVFGTTPSSGTASSRVAVARRLPVTWPI